MSFAIKHGLFKLNITDHYAILGVSLDANPKQIRLQYLKIAQKLHPDKCRSDESNIKLASQILSKLVNPAYEKLSRKNDFAEYQLVLTQIGRRLADNQERITVASESAQQLLKARDSAELVYPKLLKKITSEQYKCLEETIIKIGKISELNLVYLMLKSDPEINRNSPVSSNKTEISKQTISQSKSTVAKTTSSVSETTTKAEEPTPESRVSAFVDRAQQYIGKGEYDLAITELRDAFKIDPNHGVAHAVMGKAYLYKKQLTMAKVHIEKADKAEPHNPIVVESKKALDKLSRIANKSKNSNPNSNQKSTNKSPNSGFFNGFFGSKKK